MNNNVSSAHISSTCIGQSEPNVDLIIAVHSATRPIERAVRSVIEHNTTNLRVTVVAHNIDPQVIHHNLASFAHHPRVRVLHLADGIHSPAGPMNMGLDHATAQYVAVMGSDDTLAPGAIDSWFALAQREHADAVLARIQLGDHCDPYPPVRLRSTFTKLDPVKDRLSYRSAPLGLVNREKFEHLRFTQGLSSGEDLAYSAQLWFQGSNIAYDFFGPTYQVHDSAVDRVTGDVRELASDFEFLVDLTSKPWFSSLPKKGKQAIFIKILRIHYFDAVLSRTRTDQMLMENRQKLLDLYASLSSYAPGVEGLLSRSDVAVIAQLRNPESTPDSILRAISARHEMKNWRNYISQNVLYTFSVQGPVRTLRASR